MRALSEKTRLLIDRLRRSFWRAELHMSETERVQALAEIGQSSEASAVPSLLCFLYGDDRAVSGVAAVAIDNIVWTCNSVDIAWLDSALREVGEWQWPTINPSDVARLYHGLIGPLGALSCNTSGYVREAAVRLLAHCREGNELPFLLVRLNDWVGEVRNLAHKSIFDRLVPEYATHFIRVLPLVFRLEAQRRADHREVREAVVRMLQLPECRHALLDGLGVADRQTRKLVFRLLMNETEFPRELVDRALASDDPAIRLMAAREARVRLDGPELAEMLIRLKADGFMPVRREALYGYVERLPEFASAELRASLFDPHASIRDTARFYLRQQGVLDFAALYRVALGTTENRRLAMAVAAVGETRNVQDAKLLEPFLTHAVPRIRKAAVRAIGRLDASQRIERFLAALTDPAPGVVNAARDVLRSNLNLVPPQRLWAIFMSVETTHGRRAILALAAALRWWESAPLLVAATGCGDADIRELALYYLNRWRGNCNRLSAHPSREHLLLLETLVEKHRGQLHPVVQTDLDTHIAHAKRAFA